MVVPIVEKRIEYKGYPCVILFMPMCYRCGYVGLKRGVAYNLREIECHGGITYNEAYLWKQDDPDKSWIGFDCMHYPEEPWSLKRVENECKFIVDQIEEDLNNKSL